MKFRRLIQSRIGVGIHRVPLSDSFDWELRRLINLHEVGTVLDVGANIGGFGSRLRGDVRFEGQILSFEPGPVVADLEQRSAADPFWSVFRTALGATDDMADLLITVDSDLSSFHQPLAGMRELFPGAQVASRLKVDRHRLDGLFPELGLDARRVCLKVDTQGHDHEVLAGAGELLGRFPLVVLEASIVQLYGDQPPMEETMALMRDHGLLLCGAYPVSRRDGVVLEFDCIFARRIQS